MLNVEYLYNNDIADPLSLGLNFWLIFPIVVIDLLFFQHSSASFPTGQIIAIYEITDYFFTVVGGQRTG